ncbi:hypothetical protein [Glycomyces tritici]|uniref:Uncharacterized protein n=1 Tax=Glycomyces tritici TaxID=2665176 RepID=A0ABT7YWP4_9ACTN|nr:hypothetical protein [Glycomyces tritici]MDN3243044.1 hypothetical protein [Glycomyces tritici]
MTSSREQQRARLKGRIDRLAPDRIADIIIEHVLTERGYLDVDGFVYVHEDTVRDELDALHGGLVNRRTITLGIQHLLYWERIAEVTGSRLEDGSTTYPPVDGSPRTALLRCQINRYEDWSADADGGSDGAAFDAGVSGHTRKLRPGQQASDAAMRAHQEAKQAGQVAKNDPLPIGYTFVAEHRRRSRSQMRVPRTSTGVTNVGTDTDEIDDVGYEQYT